MYIQYYGLKEQPFSIAPDPRFLYLSEKHKEGLASLAYGISQRKGFVVITGEVGTGKTTLIRAVLEQIDQQLSLAFISNPTLTKEEFYLLLADAYKLGPIRNKAEFLIKFAKFWEKSYFSDENVVLIVDEAHKLSLELLEEVRLLSNMETPHHKLVNIILVGQVELEEKLRKPQLQPLRQRISLKFRLLPLNKQETRDYINVRLKKAGAKDSKIFTTKAQDLIYEYTGGLPRLINILSDHAMLSGYVKNSKIIDHEIIEECVQEIDLDQPSSLKVSEPVSGSDLDSQATSGAQEHIKEFDLDQPSSLKASEPVSGSDLDGQATLDAQEHVQEIDLDQPSSLKVSEPVSSSDLDSQTTLDAQEYVKEFDLDQLSSLKTNEKEYVKEFDLDQQYSETNIDPENIKLQDRSNTPYAIYVQVIILGILIVFASILLWQEIFN